MVHGIGSAPGPQHSPTDSIQALLPVQEMGRIAESETAARSRNVEQKNQEQDPRIR